MSSKRQKIEAEITKHRNEGRWTKVEESTKNLTKKYGPTDGAVVMLEAEVKLEQYLQENPPRRENVSKSKKDLSQLKLKLQESMTLECKDSLFSVQEESCMLLCKLLYAQGNTSACLITMKNIDLEKLSQPSRMPCYKLRLLADTYAYKGLCVEHAKHSRSLPDDKEDHSIIDYYEISTDLSLSYVEEYERQRSTQSSPADPPMSYGMEIAFQRGPLLHIKQRNLKVGIKRLRYVLKRLECRVVTTVQQTLCRDLATILLRGLSEISYESPSGTQAADETEGPDRLLKTPSKQKAGTSAGGSPSAAFSLSPTLNGSMENLFSPSDCTQESILLLIITEAMINADPILDMSPEYSDTRSELLRDSGTLYDLLAVALARYSQYDMFAKSIEASLKYAFDVFHLWYQYGLSIYSAGKYDRAIRAFMECCRIQPHNPAPHLHIAKISFENLNEVEQGVKYAQKALEAASRKREDAEEEDDDASDYLVSAHIAVGLGYSYQNVDGSPRADVDRQRSKALDHFEKAHEIDPYDHKPLLFMAVEMALDRRINEALIKVKQALELQPNDLNSLHLFILLRTAQKQYREPLSMLNAVCKLYPENISLLITKCKVEMYIGNNEDALCTCNNIMQIWKNLHEAYMQNTINAESMMERMTSDGLSVTNQSVGNELDIDTGSFVVNSIALSRVDRALSGIESSLGVILPRTVGAVAGNPGLLQAHIWLLTAEVYGTLKRYDEAAQCIQEASTLFPLSHGVLYMRGKLAHLKGDLDEAVALFRNTIAINPKHHKAFWNWGEIAVKRGEFQFAKKLVRDAIKFDPMEPEYWHCLGESLDLTNDVDGAVECLSTAINLESTSPILPFTTISREI